MRALVVLAVGCATSPTPPSGSSTGDTGTIGGSCEDEIAPLTNTSCVETTLVTAGPYGYDEAMEMSGSGTVTEVGGSLDPIPGSEPLDGFGACQAVHEHQVRIVDEAGEIWTFGWDVSGGVDDASTAAILPGTELDFFAMYVWYSYSRGAAIVLSDDVGPLFVLELDVEDSVLEGEGVAVDLHTDQTCVVDAEGREYYQASFTWSDGDVALWSGQTATIPLAGRDLEIVLGDDYYLSQCMDGCSEAWWAGWPE